MSNPLRIPRTSTPASATRAMTIALRRTRAKRRSSPTRRKPVIATRTIAASVACGRSGNSGASSPPVMRTSTAATSEVACVRPAAAIGRGGLAGAAGLHEALEEPGEEVGPAEADQLAVGGDRVSMCGGGRARQRDRLRVADERDAERSADQRGDVVAADVRDLEAREGGGDVADDGDPVIVEAGGRRDGDRRDDDAPDREPRQRVGAHILPAVRRPATTEPAAWPGRSSTCG
jgi:hypothetical protein